MGCLKKKSSKILSVILASVLFLSMSPVSVYASEPNSPKEEVVYVNLNADGSVKEIHVVNIFDLDEDGRIVDYGQYQSLRNMTTTDVIKQSEDIVTIDTKAGKLYYEGKMDSNVIPWNISIHYYMDDQEYTADEIAGKSGSLKISVRITKNENCKGHFFEGYALQTSLMLDTEKCSNIAAENATIANVGSRKQITCTILPDTGADFVITSDVSDFEMESMSINGIPLNLDIEVEDEELMDLIMELTNAIEEIDNGANQLQGGAGDLKSGGQSLASGTKSIVSGASALNDGLHSLNDGISQVQAGLDALITQSDTLTNGSAQMKNALVQLQTALSGVSASAEELQKLSDASLEIRKGIENLSDGAAGLQSQISFEAYKAIMLQNGLDIEALQTGNSEAIESINSLLGRVNAIENLLSAAGISTETISPVKSQCIILANQLVALLNGNNAAIDGMESYLDELNQGAASLTAGTEGLKKRYSEFDEAIGDLTNTLTGLLYQMADLKDAVNLLVEEYSKLDNGWNAYTEGTAQVAAGYSRISSGAVNLAQGSNELKNGSISLYDGTVNLSEGLIELYKAAGILNDGTSALREETAGMDAEIDEKMDDLMNGITGGSVELSSFVSDKNVNIKSVQFVIQTERIQISEVEKTTEEDAVDLSIWQKFLKLFGICIR